MNLYRKLLSLQEIYTKEYEGNKRKIEFVNQFLTKKTHSNFNELVTFYAIITNFHVDFDHLQTVLAENPIEINNMVNIFNYVLNQKPLDQKNKQIFDVILNFVSTELLFFFFEYIVALSSYPRLKIIFEKKYQSVPTDIYYKVLCRRAKDNDKLKILVSQSKRKVEITNELIDGITNFDTKPFYELSKEVIALFDTDMLRMIYNFICEQQEIEYKKLTKQLGNSESKEESIEQILNVYKISLKQFQNKEKLLKYGNIDNINEVLQSLKQAKFDFTLFEADHFLDIITFANPKDVYYIISLMNKNVIDLEFTYKYPGIFLNEADGRKDLFFTRACFQEITNKFNLINALNLDYNKYYNNEILTLDKEELIQNIKLLRSYSNNFDNQNLWCSLIINPSLFKLIDFFLENGVDFSGINFTNLTKNIDVDHLIKRLYLALSCNLPIFKSSMIDLNVLAHIENHNLSEYIPSETEYFIPKDILSILQNSKLMTINENLNTINELKPFFDNKECSIYINDDLLISKNKFLRNLSAIIDKTNSYSITDLIFFALIYGSFLNSNDINLIKSQIKKEK